MIIRCSKNEQKFQVTNIFILNVKSASIEDCRILPVLLGKYFCLALRFHKVYVRIPLLANSKNSKIEVYQFSKYNWYPKFVCGSIELRYNSRSKVFASCWPLLSSAIYGVAIEYIARLANLLT